MKIRQLLPWLEYLGGARDRPPDSTDLGAVVWGLWWAALILGIWAFAGVDSKFIYIDF